MKPDVSKCECGRRNSCTQKATGKAWLAGGFGCLVWAELRPVFSGIASVQQLHEVGRWERWLSSIELIELLDEDLSICMCLFNPELTH